MKLRNLLQILINRHFLLFTDLSPVPILSVLICNSAGCWMFEAFVEVSQLKALLVYTSIKNK